MAKRSKINVSQGQRDYTTQSLDQLLTFRPRPAPVLLPLPHPINPAELLPYGDRRLFHPVSKPAPVPAVRSSAKRLVVGRRAYNLRFADPHLVGLCARRKIRKQVLFAKRLTRKGAGSSRRRNEWSSVGC